MKPIRPINLLNIIHILLRLLWYIITVPFRILWLIVVFIFIFKIDFDILLFWNEDDDVYWEYGYYNPISWAFKTMNYNKKQKNSEYEWMDHYPRW